MKKASVMLLSVTAMCGLFAAPEVVHTRDYHFNAQDATECLQSALDSGAKKVVVDNVGQTYIIRGVNFRSNQEVIFADGVEVRAKSGEFKRGGATLFSFNDIQNTIVRGEGKVVIAMNKKDYQDQTKYSWSEWRHLMNLRGAKNITIKNLTLLSSGGDGVYVASAVKDVKKPCVNITLENLDVLDHHRQGISVISVDGLVARDCKFNTTAGTPPQSGIDFEPNRYVNMLKNVLLERCEFNNNVGFGVEFYLGPLNSKSEPVSITVKDCKMSNNRNCGLYIRGAAPDDTAVRGTLTVENCEIANNQNGAILLYNTVGALDIKIKDTKIDNRNGVGATVTFESNRNSNLDGVCFENCVFVGNKEANQIALSVKEGFGLAANVKGELRQVDTAGNTVKIHDLAKLAKTIYAPNPAKQTSMKVSSFNPNKFKAKNAEITKELKRNTYRVRQKGVFCQAVPRAGEYVVNFDVINLKKEANVKYNIVVRDQMGTLAEQIQVTQPHFEYTIKARNRNLYTFEVRARNFTIAFSSQIAGAGIVADNPVSFLKGGTQNYYITVPKDGKIVAAEIAGSSKEMVSADLIAPDGTVVLSKKNISNTITMSHTRADNAPEEVWQLRIYRPVEDFTVRLGGDVIPVLSSHAEQVLTTK